MSSDEKDRPHISLKERARAMGLTRSIGRSLNRTKSRSRTKSKRRLRSGSQLRNRMLDPSPFSTERSKMNQHLAKIKRSSIEVKAYPADEMRRSTNERAL